MTPFNRPPYVGTEIKYIEEAINTRKMCGDGAFTKKCSKWFENEYMISKALLTTSCTHATEMAVMLSDIKGKVSSMGTIKEENRHCWRIS